MKNDCIPTEIFILLRTAVKLWGYLFKVLKIDSVFIKVDSGNLPIMHNDMVTKLYDFHCKKGSNIKHKRAKAKCSNNAPII